MKKTLSVLIFIFAFGVHAHDYLPQGSKFVLNSNLEVGPRGEAIRLADSANLMKCLITFEKKARGKVIPAGTQFVISDSSFNAKLGYNNGIYCGSMGSGYYPTPVRCERVGEAYSYMSLDLKLKTAKTLIKEIDCHLYRNITRPNEEKEKTLPTDYFEAIRQYEINTLDPKLVGEAVFNNALQFEVNGPLKSRISGN